ncbi:MAG: DUF4097 domain-containing protein, partial [bacterium]|nr:DUF4097 domain-containing protein [bacterium]
SAASGNFSASGLKSDIHAKIASGDVDVNDIKGKLDVNVASGDIDVKNADGKIAVKTASGDIKITDSKGIFKLKSASGSIEAVGIVVKEASVFKGVSGNVSVKFAKGGQYNLDLATVSGNITLDYNGNAVKGYFEFKGQKGNIHSAVPFDNKDTSKYSPFVKKYFKKGGDSPHVSLKTVSGKIEFKK